MLGINHQRGTHHSAPLQNYRRARFDDTVSEQQTVNYTNDRSPKEFVFQGIGNIEGVYFWRSATDRKWYFEDPLDNDAITCVGSRQNLQNALKERQFWWLETDKSYEDVTVTRHPDGSKSYDYEGLTDPAEITAQIDRENEEANKNSAEPSKWKGLALAAMTLIAGMPGAQTLVKNTISAPEPAQPEPQPNSTAAALRFLNNASSAPSEPAGNPNTAPESFFDYDYYSNLGFRGLQLTSGMLAAAATVKSGVVAAPLVLMAMLMNTKVVEGGIVKSHKRPAPSSVEEELAKPVTTTNSFTIPTVAATTLPAATPKSVYGPEAVFGPNSNVGILTKRSHHHKPTTAVPVSKRIVQRPTASSNVTNQTAVPHIPMVHLPNNQTVQSSAQTNLTKPGTAKPSVLPQNTTTNVTHTAAALKQNQVAHPQPVQKTVAQVALSNQLLTPSLIPTPTPTTTSTPTSTSDESETSASSIGWKKVAAGVASLGGVVGLGTAYYNREKIRRWWNNDYKALKSERSYTEGDNQFGVWPFNDDSSDDWLRRCLEEWECPKEYCKAFFALEKISDGDSAHLDLEEMNANNDSQPRLDADGLWRRSHGGYQWTWFPSMSPEGGEWWTDTYVQGQWYTVQNGQWCSKNQWRSLQRPWQQNYHPYNMPQRQAPSCRIPTQRGGAYTPGRNSPVGPMSIMPWQQVVISQQQQWHQYQQPQPLQFTLSPGQPAVMPQHQQPDAATPTQNTTLRRELSAVQKTLANTALNDLRTLLETSSSSDEVSYFVALYKLLGLLNTFFTAGNNSLRSIIDGRTVRNIIVHETCGVTLGSVRSFQEFLINLLNSLITPPTDGTNTPDRYALSETDLYKSSKVITSINTVDVVLSHPDDRMRYVTADMIRVFVCTVEGSDKSQLHAMMLLMNFLCRDNSEVSRNLDADSRKFAANFLWLVIYECFKWIEAYNNKKFAEAKNNNERIPEITSPFVQAGAGQLLNEIRSGIAHSTSEYEIDDLCRSGFFAKSGKKILPAAKKELKKQMDDVQNNKFCTPQASS